MGLVLDSSVLVVAERRQMVTEIVLSAISIVELEHGIYRAQSPQ